MTLPRVYPIVDTACLERLAIDPVTCAEAFLEGGAGILQLRHKGFWGREMFEVARQLKSLCDDAGVPFVINDRADMARLLDAGLHLGQEDLLPSDARIVMGSTPLIGFSTHNEDQMRAALAEPVDYVAIGPIFSTTSKERPDRVVGTDRLRTIRTMVTRPLVAIGGITRENASACWNAGADSVAIIADLLPPSGGGSAEVKRNLRDRMAEWQQLSRS